MFSLHRVLLAALLVGNTIAFAGVDPPTKLITAVIVAALMIDMRRIPAVPRVVHAAAWGFLVLVAVQLIPLPVAFRQMLQPGFSAVMHTGWAPLSLAPWATIQVTASAVVVTGIVLVSARMASTRSGLPLLLGMVAATCGLMAVLGLAGEAGAPQNVLLVRANTGGGGVYGPFVNPNTGAHSKNDGVNFKPEEPRQALAAGFPARRGRRPPGFR